MPTFRFFTPLGYRSEVRWQKIADWAALRCSPACGVQDLENARQRIGPGDRGTRSLRWGEIPEAVLDAITDGRRTLRATSQLTVARYTRSPIGWLSLAAGRAAVRIEAFGAGAERQALHEVASRELSEGLCCLP